MKELRDFQSDVARAGGTFGGWRRSYQQELMQYVTRASISLRSCTEIDSLLQRIATEVAGIPGFRRISLYLHDSTDFCQVCTTGDGREIYLRQQALPAHAVEALMSDEYRLDNSYVVPADAAPCEDGAVKRMFGSVEPRRSEGGLLIVPLNGNKGVLGLIVFADPLGGFPPPPEAAFLLELFASQLFVLLERTHLQEEMRRISEERVALIEVSHALSSPTALSDQQMIYRTIYEQIRRLMPVNIFFICHYDAARKKLLKNYVVDDGLVRRLSEQEEMPPEITCFLWPEKKYALFSREEYWDYFRQKTGMTPEKFRPLWDRPAFARVQTILYLPIKYAGEPVGLLCVMSNEVDCYQQEQVHMLEEIGVQASLAIKSAQMYTELRSALEQAQASERLKNQFLMTASHELRTPLTAIQGYLELLNDFGETLTSEAKMRFVSNAHRACEELVLLVGNVMDASHIEQDKVELKPSLVRLDEAIQAVVEILDPIIVKDKRCVSVCVPEGLSVWSDDLRLRQIFLNLLGNALKYTPASTPIAIQAKTLSREELGHRLTGAAATEAIPTCEQYALISVRDWGPGVAPEMQDRLFDKFVRLESAINSMQRGAGLGLYLCRQLTEAMHGYIWMESTGVPGEGSTFQVALPLSA